MTRDELIAKTGLVNNTVSRWLNILSKPPYRLVYVESWKRKADRGCYAKVWAAGFNQSDAPRPARMTNAEYHRRYLQKLAKAEQSKLESPAPGILRHTVFATAKQIKEMSNVRNDVS